MKETLRGAERHEDAAVFKAIGGLQNSDHVKDTVPDGHMVSKFCGEKISSPLAENHVIGVLRER